MTISWNQWVDAAARTPKAGQIRSTADQEVIRAKRPWGTHLLSAERLDRNRTPEEIQANRDSLAELRASLSEAFGETVAEVVYAQLFNGRQATGRPISARDIRLADGLATHLKGAQDWLVARRNQFDPDIALQAFAQVMRQPLPIRRDRLPAAELVERVGQAKDLAVKLQGERNVDQNRERMLELFAATPGRVTDPQGQVLFPRENLRRELMEMIDAPEQAAGSAELTPGEGHAAAAGHAVDLEHRRNLLRRLLPSNDQLLAMDYIEERASEIEVVVAQLQAARAAHDEAAHQLAAWRARLPPDLAVSQAQSDLTAAQAALNQAQRSREDTLETLNAAIHALSEVQAGADALSMTLDELNLLDQEAQALRLELADYQARWADEVKPLLTQQIQAELKLAGIKGIHFIDKKTQRAAVRAAEQRADEAERQHLELGKPLARRADMLKARRQTLLARLDEQGKSQATSQSKTPVQEQAQALVAQRRADVQVAQAAWLQACGASDACEKAMGQAHQALESLEQTRQEAGQQISEFEALTQTRQAELERADRNYQLVQARSDPALQQTTETLVAIRSLERGRSEPSDYTLQQLRGIDWMLQLKVHATPEGSPELPSFHTLAMRVRDEWMGQLSEMFIEQQEDPGSGYRIVVPDDQYRDYVAYQSHFQLGTSVNGASGPSPELMVAYAMNQIRHHDTSPNDAAQRALFRSSEDDRFAMLALLEKRQRDVQSGVLEASAFDEVGQALLPALRNQIGLGPVLQKHVIVHGGSLDAIVGLYEKAKRLVHSYEQDIAEQEAAVREGRQAQLDRSRTVPLVSALREALRLFLRPDPAGQADPEGEDLSQQIAQAVQNVQTSQEKLGDARQLRDFSALILQAVSRPSNDEALKSMVRMHFLKRFDKFPEDRDFENYLTAMRQLVPEELRTSAA